MAPVVCAIQPIMLECGCVPEEWVRLTMQRGVRTNVPTGSGANPWHWKYMLHGLHVETEPFSDIVMRVHWAVNDSAELQMCRDAFSVLEPCTK